MKAVTIVLLLILLVSASGCMTSAAYGKAKGQANVLTGDQPTEAQPGYYALLPLTVPLDVATFPVQILVLLSQ